jgi:NAD(P)-dependent dehydrogenase (short-subunit alcohol dehydrogenase family)
VVELAGKIAVVTGSTSGIGVGIARVLLREGAAVVLHGRDASKAVGVTRVLVEEGAHKDRIATVVAELSRPEDCALLAGLSCERFGGVDVLVNNAADFRRGTLETTDLELWDYQMNVNLRAPFLLAKALVPSMRQRGGGSIVNIGSVNAYVGQPDLTAYSASKGGLMTLTRNLASQLAAGEGRVRVNQINVGWVLTEGEVRVQLGEGAAADWADAAGKTRPLKRLLLPSEVAEAVLYFAGPRGEAVSGSVLDFEQFPTFTPVRG